MKKLPFIFILLLLAVITACEHRTTNGDPTGDPYDPSKPLQLTEFLPETGGMTSPVIIKGSNFGNDPSRLKVYFNKKRAKVVKTTGNLAYILTPRLPGDTCSISVAIGNDSLPKIGRASCRERV